MENILKSRVFLVIVAFVAGGFVSHILTPEKIVEKEVEVVKWQTKEVEKEVVKWKTKIVKEEVKVTVSEKKIKRKETFPDGHTIEEEIYESNSEQVARIEEQEKQKYNEKIAYLEQEYQNQIKSLKIHLNPKPFNLFAGVNTNLTRFNTMGPSVGITGSVWGPFTLTGYVGAERFTGGTVNGAAMFGVRF